MTQYIRLIWQLLDTKQRRHYSVLQGLFVLAALVQVLGVASIAPFIALLSRPELIEEYAVIAKLYHALEFSSPKSFLIAFAFALMIVIAISNMVPAAMMWLVWSFTRRLGAELQADILHGYLHGDLAQVSRVNSAEMIRVIMHGVNKITYLVVQPALSLGSSLLVIIFIAAALVVYDGAVAVSAGALIGGGYAVVYVFTRKRLSVHGQITWDSVSRRQKLLAESLGGIKELRLAGTAYRYEDQFAELTASSLNSEAMIGILKELPRYVLETIALSALLLLGIVLLLQREDLSSIVAILSVYAMAGYRLLPAAQTVFHSAATIKSNIDAIGDVKVDVQAGRALRGGMTDSTQHAISSEGSIVLSNVSFSYPDAPQPVISNLSLSINRNSIAALVGHSGAGKSTVADLLMGLLRPSSGEILVGGVSIFRSLRSWQRQVAFVSQSVFLIDDTIEANIAFGSQGGVDPDRVRSAAHMANAASFIDQLPNGYQYIVGEDGGRLSGGQRQRIGIARALYNDAEVIILDEPTSALDSLAEREILGTLRSLSESKTIVIITHRLSTLQNADSIFLIVKGRLASAGSFADLLSANHEFAAFINAERT